MGRYFRRFPRFVIGLCSAAICVFVIFLLQPNKAEEVSVPRDLTLEQVLDPNGYMKETEQFFISEDKGYFDLDLEERLQTKSISQFVSTGYKTMMTIPKSELFAKLDREIVSLYYLDASWWNFMMRDSCAAVLKDESGQLYIVAVNPSVCTS